MKKILLILLLIWSNLISEDNLYLGIQSSNPSDGLSVKMDITHKTAIQGIFDLTGERRSYSFRTIYRFKNRQFYNIYGFGEIGIWDWDRAYHHKYQETALGFGVGGGVEYDLRGLDWDFWPIFISAELGIYKIDFDDTYYYYDDGLGLGLGLHYKF
jgi:hypothetical protein